MLGRGRSRPDAPVRARRQAGSAIVVGVVCNARRHGLRLSVLGVCLLALSAYGGLLGAESHPL
jgi:hypothetical protein